MVWWTGWRQQRRAARARAAMRRTEQRAAAVEAQSRREVARLIETWRAADPTTPDPVGESKLPRNRPSWNSPTVVNEPYLVRPYVERRDHSRSGWWHFQGGGS